MKFRKLTPNFEVSDIAETVRFYQSVMGFTLTAAVPETQDGADTELVDGKAYVFAIMTCDSIELMFQRSDSFKQDVKLASSDAIGASVSFYFEIDGIQELHASLKDKVKDITAVKMTWYGVNEFYMKDCNGYLLGFGEKAQ